MTDTEAKPENHFLSVLSGNFSMISALLTLFSGVLAMVFVFGYLSVFDPFLIMIIEYSDLLKFILLGIIIAYGIIAAFNNIIYTLVDWYIYNKYSFGWASALFLSIIVTAGMPIFFDWKSHPEYLAYEGYRLFSVILGCLTLYIFMSVYKNRQTANIYKVFNATMLLTIFCVLPWDYIW